MALADDASAAFANPAGLVQLARPELSIEGRQWSFSTPVTVGGRITGQPTGIGLDDTPGLRTADSPAEVSGLSFLSFVYPRKKWSFAIYRHQLANFELTWETRGLFDELSGCQAKSARPRRTAGRAIPWSSAHPLGSSASRRRPPPFRSRPAR